MQPGTNPIETEQHDPEKPGLKKERGQNFECDHWANRWPSHLPEPGEAKPEFERQNNSRNDSDAESHGEDAQPESIDLQIQRILGPQPHSLDDRQEHRQPDGHRWEDDVEADREGELDAREYPGVEGHCPVSSVWGREKTSRASATNRTSAPTAAAKPNTPMIAKKNV